VISTSNGAVTFDLAGPGGYTAFTNQESNSGPITLPSSGNYILSAQGTGGQGGSYAFELEQTSVTDLTLGTPYNGSLAGSGQAQLFEVNVPATQALVVRLQDSSADVNQLYAKLGSPPTPENYGYSSSNGVTASPQLLVPSAAPGTWYILEYSVSVPLASTFTLTASGEPITLTTVAPAESAAGSTAALTLTGSGFSSSSMVRLVSMANTVYKARSVSLDTFTQLTATFDLGGVPQGVYSVVVTNAGAQSASLAGAFTVTAAGEAHFVSHLILPSKMGRHISSTIYVEYANTGSVAMPAPLLVLSAPPEVVDGQTITNLPLFTLNPALVVSGYWTSALPEGYSNSVEILATGSEVPGWLEPGESMTVPVYYAGMQQPWSFAETSFQFALNYYDLHDSTALDWSSLQASLQPPGISNQAWSAMSSSLATQVGDTWGDYVTMLDDEANYLGQLGEDVTDVSQLWSFAMMQADGLTPAPVLDSETDIDMAVPGQLSLDFSRVYQEPLSSRDAIGPLGYGWSDDLQYSLSVASDGTVTVTMPTGEQRTFQPDSRGSDYFDQPGDYGILTEGSGGTFSLQETNGQIEVFNANGTLDYIQDTNGNRITAGYNSSGLLSSLTETSGASMSIAYTPQGLIASVTSFDGRIVNYTYDSGEHLISVQSYDGELTQYTYESGSDAATENALTSITNPDGTSQNFTYNSSGQLAGSSQAGGADPVTYSYNLGKVTVTDAASDASQYYFDENGELVKTVDPLGNVTFATYDSNGDLTSLTGPTGLSTKYTYDSNGNLISSTDALGQTTSYTYTSSDNLLASVTNAQGATTNYNYNASGDLTSTEYPDDSVETATYDALGDPLSLTDQDGQVTNSTYNAAGQVVSETLAGGSTMAYTYDAQRNLITATDSSGATTLTYNSADELTSIVYPTDLSLQYTYNAGGQRTQMVEMSGSTITYTVNYSYNSLGQLVQLTDGTGANIIQYTYNNIGELIREDKGDGTYSTHTYDADGNVLDLVNYAANGTVDSSFVYTYNALDEETSMATVDGTWTYGYDNDGELVTASFASTDSAIPDQSLTYVYNAAGDRTQTIINGVTTNYTSNSVNEYTTVGGTTYEYDADGNLISMTDASGTTTYSYNSLNQLTGVNSPSGSWSYQYDALGNLVATISNDQTTDNLIDPTGLGNLVGQYTSSGSLIASYTYGLGQVSQVTPDKTNYYQFDALGSTVGLTNATSGLVASYSYLPFGGLLVSTGTVANPFTFVGQFGVSTDGSGLYDMAARSYDAMMGQFVSNDPSGIAGGDINVRRYVTNSPTDYIDPAGLEETQSIHGDVNAIFFQVSFVTNKNASGEYSTSLDISPYLGIPGFSIGGAKNWGGEPEVTASIGPIDLQYGSSGLVGGGASIGTSDLLGPIGEIPSFTWSPILSIPLWSSQSHQQPHYFKLHAEVDVPRESATPTPPPPKIKCVPLSPSDTGYGFFSGSLGSTTMCRPPGSGGGGGGGASTAGSFDPNAMIGPNGYGPGIFVSGSALTLFPYQIDFENSPTATAPAQQVVITDTFDTNLDLNTFQLTEIDFGDTVLSIPSGSQDYQNTVPMTYNGVTFDVVINASLDYATRTLTVKFQSIDPTTQLPPSVLTGFLPPEDGTGRGSGYVGFMISPNSGLTTGTQIRNVADIVFDGNSPIATDQVNDEDPSRGIDPTKQAPVTIDNTTPTSSVNPLPATEGSTNFAVSWSGSDGDGSGIAYYNVYVSEDGGTFNNFRMDTTETSTTFTGQVGHTYSFISIATSNVGLSQPEPSSGQAMTQILLTPPPSQPAPPVLVAADDSGTKGDNITDDASPAFSGTTQAGATVQLLNGTMVIGTAIADASGSYVVPVQGPLSPAMYQLTIVASNSGGSSPASNPLSLTIVAAPATATAPTLLPADSNGSPGGETTTSTSPYLVGTTLAGATVQLLNANGTVVNTTQANSSGSYQVQIPGPLGVGSYAFHVDVIDQYGDVSSPSPTQTVTVVNTQTTTPLVTVESLQVETIKVGKGKKAKKEAVLVLQFSGALDAGDADNSNAYGLAPVIKVKASGKGKNRKPATTKLGAPVAPASAAYNPSTNSVTLTPRATLTASKPEELIVNGALVMDMQGREIDGADDGQPGSDYIATITGARATAGGVPLVRSQRQPATVADMIDHLLAHGELAGLRHSHRAWREGHREE
jgi:RHS repeat-associated protein